MSYPCQHLLSTARLVPMNYTLGSLLAGAHLLLRCLEVTSQSAFAGFPPKLGVTLFGGRGHLLSGGRFASLTINYYRSAA